VTFNSKSAAETAKSDLQQGVRFDPDLPQTLRLEFAKSNTKVTKPKTANNNNPGHPAHHAAAFLNPFGAQDFAATAAFFPTGTEAAAWGAPLMNSFELPAALQHQQLLQQQIQLPPHLMAQVPGMAGLTSAAGLGHLTAGQLAAVSSQAGLGGTTLQAAYADSGFGSLQASPIMATSPTAQVQQAPLTPSNTLFVTNLGPFCREQELSDLFNSFPGYVRLRMTKQPVHMQTGGSSLCAFVEYQDIRTSTDAMTRLQGFVLLSSENRGGIRIEYAKAKIAD